MFYTKIFIHFLLMSVFISSCKEHNASRKFHDNVKEFNDFSEQKENPEEKVIVFSNPFHEERQVCRKASLVIKDVKLNQLAKILSNAYNTEISYALQPNAKSSDNQNSKDSIPEEEKDDSFDDTETFSMSFDNVCLSEVLDTLVDTYDIGVIEKGEGYQIYNSDYKTITYEINYHNFKRSGSSSISISSSQLSGNSSSQNHSSISSTSEDKFWDSITNAVNNILQATVNNKTTTPEPRARARASSKNTNSNFYVYREAGLIVVTASPKQHKNINIFLKKANNNAVSQVMIEAKILEISLYDEFATGVQWDVLKNNLYQKGLKGGGHSSVAISSGIETHKAAASIVSSARGTIGRDFHFIMQALNSQGKLSVVSSPKVSTINNQRALFKSGEDKYVVTNVTNSVTDSTTSSSTKQSSYNTQALFSGVSLDATPTIINNKEILLHIHPMISSVKSDEADIVLNEKNTKIQVPRIETREVDTIVKAKSGDIIILGGLTRNETSMSDSQLPMKPTKGFSKIFDMISPKQSYNKVTELIILIKPTIVNNFSNVSKSSNLAVDLEDNE